MMLYSARMHMQTTKTQAKTDGLLLFRYERFINFWLRFFDTSRETLFLKVFRNLTMLTTPLTFANTTQANTNTYANRQTLLFRYERFINFWLRFFDTRRERQFLKVFRNLTMLTPTRNVRHISWCLRSQFISAGRDPKKSTLRLNGRSLTSRLHGRNSILWLHSPMSTSHWLFFKILKFSGPSFPYMTSSTLQPHSLSGVNYDNGDCHILCARA